MRIGVTVTTAKGNEFDISDLIKNASDYVETISIDELFVGYYADVDGDGTVDGIIYVDLMHEQTAEYWSPGSTSSTYITYGTYSWDTIDSSKDYYVSQESYKGAFGTADVIRPVDGSTGNDRFYVMALSYFTTDDYTTFYWYYSAYNNRISDYSTVVSSDFGAGKENTETMISYWNNKTYGSQNVRDIWGLIQDEVNKGWFVPSRGELAAFNSELGRTRGTSSWTSSLSSAASACCDPVSLGYIYSTAINSTYSVRLSTIF